MTGREKTTGADTEQPVILHQRQHRCEREAPDTHRQRQRY